MKAYILTDEDFEKLKAELSRDPRHGDTGGGSVVLSEEEKEAYDKAHSFYWYRVLCWMDKVKK